MVRDWRGSVLLAILGAAALLTDVPGVAAHGGDPALIHGCLGPRGQLRVVAPADACGPRETPLDWSAQGASTPALANGIRSFLVSDVFEAPAGVTRVLVEAWGAGGGGGGASGGGGGGGGAGGYVKGFVDVVPGTIHAVSVGAPGAGGVAGQSGTDGGDTSFGSLISAAGGQGGAPGAAGNVGGAGGLGGQGDPNGGVLVAGREGSPGFEIHGLPPSFGGIGGLGMVGARPPSQFPEKFVDGGIGGTGPGASGFPGGGGYLVFQY